MAPRYCVILPTYNNSGTLADVVERTLKVCPDVIVVNDGSTDNTQAVLCGLEVTVLNHDRNRGIRQDWPMLRRTGLHMP